MPLAYEDLDDRTRSLMLEEIERDSASGALYIGSYLNDAGRAAWTELLPTAARSHNDAWLAERLRNGLMKQTVERPKPKGGYTMVRVPVTAPEMLAEGEFNRFYIRALCRRALADGIAYLVIYRAKAVQNPRPESEARIGSTVDPQAVLDDLRANPGVETALGLPPGPNSGLSARLPPRP
jgi:hypothetical protein